MPVQPPRPRMPPLNALRAFEAAGRLGGFSQAAQELGVTPGAITAHLKGLESELGAPLFERNARGVQLTPLGARVLPGLSVAFDALNAAVQTLHAEAAPQLVRIAALPALAQLWLSPRLPALRAAEPDIRVSITALESPPETKRDPHDLYLFFVPEGAARLGAVLTRDSVFPVCAPDVADRLRTPPDLKAEDCLSDSTWSDDWPLWARAAGLGPAFRARGPVFSLYALAVEEAVNGAGVLPGHAALVARHLADKRLVQPFGPVLSLPRVLALWPARRITAGSPVDKVARWLMRGG